jgi:NhaA family Na+:H+ antiporter
VLHSGVHATVAGVVAALTVPLGLLERLEHRLAGWNAYLVVPLFGFANAGVSLSGLGWGGVLAPLPLAVGAGLMLGKQLGICAAIAIADRIGFAARPTGASWAQIWGVSLLAGIGFTMSLFIAALAFPLAPMLVEEAKIGILGGSLVSAVLGYGVLRLAGR